MAEVFHVWNNYYRTYVNGGPNTGTPTNGQPVQVWDDEGSNDFEFATSTDSPAATLEDPGSMAAPALLADGSNDTYSFINGAGTVNRYSGDLFGTFPTAWTIDVAFQLVACSTNNANSYDNACIYSDEGGYIHIFVKNASGVYSIGAANYDDNFDVVTPMTISLNTTYVIRARKTTTQLFLYLFSGAGGVTQNSGSVTSGNTHSGHNGQYLHPFRNYNAAQFFNGRVGEMWFYNSDEGSSSANLTTMINRWLPATASGILMPPARRIYQSLMAM